MPCLGMCRETVWYDRKIEICKKPNPVFILALHYIIFYKLLTSVSFSLLTRETVIECFIFLQGCHEHKTRF